MGMFHLKGDIVLTVKSLPSLGVRIEIKPLRKRENILTIKENRKDMISKKPRGRKHRPLDKIHSNTPRRLVREYKKLGCNQLHLAKKLKINDGYLNRLMKDGIEPTDRTEKGRDARAKMFLHNHPLSCKTCGRKVIHHSSKPKVCKPDFIVQWDHLPKEERHKVIKQYLQWKENNVISKQSVQTDKIKS